MDVVVERCAGLDVHKDTVVACVRTPGMDGQRQVTTRTFATMTVDLLGLRDWLVAEGVTLVGMESTGVYWRAPFYVLEDAMECWLLNARHLRNVPGRKTDVADAEWIAQLVEHGLVRPSFVPPPPIRELRTLTRYRKAQIDERSREAQRLDKVLQDAGIKLSSVATDILGKSGRDMLAALVAGTRDPEVLAELARGRLRAKLSLLTKALEGRFGPTHALVVGEVLAHLDYLDEAIARLSGRVEELIAPFGQARDLLVTIPGVDVRVAEGLIAEIGTDMGRFPTAGHLASWAGMCPGQHESAGKSRSGRARHGDVWLQRYLTVAAMAAARTKGSYFSAQYGRLVRTRGKAKARKAVGHSLLVVVWHVLDAGVPYAELGDDWFERRNDPARRARRHLADLHALGWTVHTNDDGTTTLIPPAVAAA
ncbi:MAG: IS110 family transposase [Acidimicrobiales bacterium]